MIDTIRRLFQPQNSKDSEVPHIRLEASLSAKHIRYDGTVEDYGVVSRKKVTTVFVNHLVDSLQGSGTNWTDYKYHISGTGGGAESNADVVTTFTNVDDNATVGTQAEGASANIYKSVGTLDYTSSKAIVEHGLINANDTASAVLMDRSVFGAINVTDGDSIEFTYELTAQAET